MADRITWFYRVINTWSFSNLNNFFFLTEHTSWTIPFYVYSAPQLHSVPYTCFVHTHLSGLGNTKQRLKGSHFVAT